MKLHSPAPKRRIRVAIVINDFLIGGAQKLIVDLVTRLDRARFEVTLVTLFRFSEDEREYLYDVLPDDICTYKLRFRGIGDFGAWSSLYKALREIDSDIVLSNLFFSNTVTRILSLFFRYRTFIVEHNTYTKKPPLHQLVDRILVGVTDGIVAVSETVATFTARQENIPLSKFIVIHNGIALADVRADRDQYDMRDTLKEAGFSPEKKIILNVSRVVPQKNHRLLLDGFEGFVRKHPDYRLLLVGGGSHLEKMKSYANERGLGESVHFLGYRKDVPRFFAIADFFVSTSLIEGFGIAHAEALACGLPVLTTKTAGPDQMIKEGTNGFFIEDYTTDAVMAGLEKMASLDLSPFRIVARESSEMYSIDRSVRAYEELFFSAFHSQKTP